MYERKISTTYVLCSLTNYYKNIYTILKITKLYNYYVLYLFLGGI